MDYRPMSSPLRWMLPLLSLATLGSTVEPGMTQAVETATVLLEETGRLEAGDAILDDGSLADVYEISGQAGQTLSITLESIEFDPYLLFQTATGETLDQNDDVIEDNRQSHLSLSLPETGTYRIVAHAYAAWQRGSYRLTVVDGEQPPALSDAALEQTEANRLNSLGIEQNRVGQYREAVLTLQTALEIYQRLGDVIGEGRAYANLGIAYESLGEYRRAIDFHEQDLAIALELGDRGGEGRAYGNLGNAYYSLGDYSRAIDFHEQTLAIMQELGDRGGEGSAYGNLGVAYDSLGEYRRAIDFHEQHLAIALELGDRDGEGRAYGNLGLAYNRLGEYRRAIDFHEQRLTIALELGDRGGEGRAYANLGIAYESLGEYRRATEASQEALAIFQGIEADEATGIVLSNIGRLLSLQEQPTLAIVFYKQSVQVREDIRSKLKGLSNDLQETYTTTVETDYRALADLLLQQDRILEAQQVLDLLKVQELDDYLRGVRGFGFTLAILEPEREILERYNLINETAITIGKRLADLRKIPQTDRSTDQQSEISKLVELQEDINQQFRAFARSQEVLDLLDNLTPAVEDATVRLTSLNRLGQELPKLNAALLTPLILDDRLEIILTTPNSPPIRRTVSNLKKDTLNDAILALRQSLTDRSQNPLPAAQQLYDALIRPIEDELAQSGVDSIIYAPDGQLRYVPLSALHDGENWLIQTYRVNNITAESLSKFDDTPRGQPTVLAGAFADNSIVHEVDIDGETVPFAGLPFAGAEVNNLEQTFDSLTKFEDGTFSLANVKGIMNEHTILHFATHAAFVTSSPEESFILFGNGDRPNLLEIENWSLGNVDLVVLSACETGLDGFGNGAEILGMGYQFQIGGAGAVMASLWSVDDRGTQDLMGRFYHHLSNGVGKADALQQAQADLITGNGQPSDTTRGGFVPVKETLPDSLQGLRHPYYWAPFILIGNGL